MSLFLTLAAGIWGLGWALKVPARARWWMIFALYVIVVVSLFVFPEEAGLRASLGGTASEWLALGGLGLLAAAYGRGLRYLRTRVRPENRADAVTPVDGATLSDSELDRYARHIMLREVGGTGQRRLKQARVLVIGAGGLGSPVLQYLAAAGVGTIGLIDDDSVEATNLQRQVIHQEKTVGMAKVFSAEQAMTAINPHLVVRPYHRRFTAEIAASLVAEYDLVLDGCDNFETRQLVNQACVAAGVPLVSGAISQWEGQVSVFEGRGETPCYHCIFPHEPAAGLAPSCAEAGVVGPLPGVIGSMMALEALKVITGAGTPLKGAMIVYDGLYGESRKIDVARRADCPICGDLVDRTTVGLSSDFRRTSPKV
ncbi:molybdopterin-synthase adenylyltransferase MoeB [Pseudoruegeria sp. SK021]|uniref:HesA/MoeB/ThiF family protein n=1 Tax=Pseudoruegeria sp. SK021 TaxID=1933035 RepID=UPI000A248B8B|nr:molybdopterin-synthase adenylyltransferase MoeB [Pseudoruegeria sp. SK021]OSP56060.1 molybdopterin biosynthesis protein [Pseudoruegeria sp. SK021]